MAPLALVLTTILSGCASGASGDGNKAGGTEPVVLRMANSYGDLNQLPAVAYFVDRVEELSGGNIDITVADRYGSFAEDVEEQVVRDVAAGEMDLGWVGTRIFDTMGVSSFQALTAPMLVDSYALQNALIESGITGEMMDALDDVGVTGLSVLAGGLRKPIGIERPIVGPADWQGIGLGTYKSENQEQAIRALGATPALVFGPRREDAIASDTIQGFEMGLFIYRDPKWVVLAPHVTANVSLWPQMDVLIVSPDRLERLTDEQRAWLQQAADEAAGRSASLADTDARAIEVTCETGARFAEASEADLAALKGLFAPVYASLQRDRQTKAFIEQIEALKRSISAEPAPTIPAGCTGQPAEQTPAGTGTVPAYLGGTYRYEITLDEATEADMVDPEDTYPIVDTVILSDGDLEGGCFGSAGGSYRVHGERLTFHSVEYNYAVTVSFSRDDDGNLHLTPIPPMDRGDAFQCFSQVWTKID